MAGIRAGAITAVAKAVSKSHENEKRRKSAARTCKRRDCQSGELQSEIHIITLLAEHTIGNNLACLVY